MAQPVRVCNLFVSWLVARRDEAELRHPAGVDDFLPLQTAGAPHVLCGDFNFGPRSAPYDLLTSGLAADHPHRPPAAHPAELEPPGLLASAYVAAGGQEPDFTNLANSVGFV